MRQLEVQPRDRRSRSLTDAQTDLALHTARPALVLPYLNAHCWPTRMCRTVQKSLTMWALKMDIFVLPLMLSSYWNVSDCDRLGRRIEAPCIAPTTQREQGTPAVVFPPTFPLRPVQDGHQLQMIKVFKSCTCTCEMCHSPGTEHLANSHSAFKVMANTVEALIALSLCGIIHTNACM